MNIAYSDMAKQNRIDMKALDWSKLDLLISDTLIERTADSDDYVNLDSGNNDIFFCILVFDYSLHLFCSLLCDFIDDFCQS
jgi:hypothetical protein